MKDADVIRTVSAEALYNEACDKFERRAFDLYGKIVAGLTATLGPDDHIDYLEAADEAFSAVAVFDAMALQRRKREEGA